MSTSASMQQQANAEHTELSELRKKLRTLHGVHQLQTGALESLRERHGTCENIAQAMALELQRICVVFNDANEKLEPPLPLDSIHALLASWDQYASQ